MFKLITTTFEKIKDLKIAFVALILLVFLAACDADAANHAIFRETLDPFYEQLETGMSQTDLDTLLAENVEIEKYEYAYSSEHAYAFGYDESEEIEGDIYQISMGGDPSGSDVNSICFIKVLLVDDGAGGKHILDFADVDCPA